MEKHICIHGHFYQPPRENPWLEDIELQDSAHPYHDWNKRITAECYAPNARSRILNERGFIKKITNNYSRISFNFGPTLLDWLEYKKPGVYRAIIEADRQSRENFSGHGSALAQPYNHMIMPLSNRRDKYTQIAWGIRNFQYRFQRDPEGMWLPETAVDLETLEIMAEHDIQFTILAPYQAARIRKEESEKWEEIGPRGIDPSMPYLLKLPSGRKINIFFYDGPISQAVAFEGLLASGENFAHRLLTGFSQDRHWTQLVNIATDGETYGHHHRYGDMALAYALDYIESNNLAHITNYGEHLEKFPPSREVEIKEDTSWSCAHGVRRWADNCGCNSGMHQEWSQEWRKPLRRALDKLRDSAAPYYEKKAGSLLKAPWTARDNYIEIILDRTPQNIDLFFENHAVKDLTPEEKINTIKLLELQRHALYMYTSCGWFFDDISGIETVQVLRYAGRVIQLARELFDLELEPEFTAELKEALSNVPKHKDGAYIFENYVKPAMVDLLKVGAHYAISSLFKPYEDKTEIFCYSIERHDYHEFKSDNIKLLLGRAEIKSKITMESAKITFLAIKPDNYNINARVNLFISEQNYQSLLEKIAGTIEQEDLPGVNHLLDTYFEGVTYSLKQLFKDEQRKILNLVLNSTLNEIEENFREIYHNHASLMLFLKSLRIPQPKSLLSTVEYVLNTDLSRALLEIPVNFQHVYDLLNEAEKHEISINNNELSFNLQKNLEKIASRYKEEPLNLDLLKTLKKTAEFSRTMPFETDLWKVQNIYYNLLHTVYPEVHNAPLEDREEWYTQFEALGDILHVEHKNKLAAT